MREEELDWSQSKRFLVFTYCHSHTIPMGEFPFLPIPVPYQDVYFYNF